MLRRKLLAFLSLATFHGMVFFGINAEVTEDNIASNKAAIAQVSTKIKITKQEIEEAICSFAQQKREMVASMISEYKKMTKRKQKETIRALREKINEDPANNQDIYDMEAFISRFAMSGLVWYLDVSRKEGQQERFFKNNESEKKKFEKAIFNGELIGISPKISIVKLGTVEDILLLQGNMERAAMFILNTVVKDLESQMEKMTKAENTQETENQEFITTLFEKYATEFKEEFLYNLLILHLSAKISKSVIRDVLVAIK